ncbi:hypothetical protein DL98DRAFT_276892 [Cadophora sp. DSE1049]|nr:hypothetical protein DL98DRAFT_276892 [Cadophora sp. DSE1049]
MSMPILTPVHSQSLRRKSPKEEIQQRKPHPSTAMITPHKKQPQNMLSLPTLAPLKIAKHASVPSSYHPTKQKKQRKATLFFPIP